MANQLTMADINRIKTLAEAGWSGRRIARETGYDRGTIRKYIDLARRADASEKPPDSDDSSNPDSISKPASLIAGNSARSRSVCESFRPTIESLLDQGLTAERVHRELVDNHGFSHSYPSVY